MSAQLIASVKERDRDPDEGDVDRINQSAREFNEEIASASSTPNVTIYARFDGFENAPVCKCRADCVADANRSGCRPPALPPPLVITGC